MSPFTSMPVELQCQCIQSLDVPSLKAFRLVSRSSARIGFDELFRTVVLGFSDESVARFAQVLGDERTKPLVKNIVVEIGAAEQEMNEDYEINEDWEIRETTWALAIPTIAEFPSVRHVDLVFDDQVEFEDGEFNDWYEDEAVLQPTEYREHYMKLMYWALEKAGCVDSLAIKCLQDELCECKNDSADNGQATSVCKMDCWCLNASFLAARSPLKRLALHVATGHHEHLPQNDIKCPALHACFNSGLLNLWLKPLQPQLIHLTLYADAYWGVWPYIELRGIYFPNLKSLALGNFTIAHDWQIDWLASHGATLEELILDNCPIARELYLYQDSAAANWPDLQPTEDDRYEKMYETRWHHVFPLFQEKLRKLRHFGIGSGSWPDHMFDRRYELPAKIAHNRYASFNQGYQRRSPWSDDEDGRELVAEDKAALEALLLAIGYTKKRIEWMADAEWDAEEGWI
ncbi:hypothetical protein BDV95DRAFT_563582 [Massariosphaeria phaeospora]|uniref:F-box domain-containing protein n=1 Tax=Massariosphaeria phaeospora TaxID=100035 RepID=A0A7C8MD80_9PLEO|nr:hypothetical protein BDV95DRAFT_563582 [Massariosphaeria phaeospora]